jgi:hypothetical protein
MSVPNSTRAERWIPGVRVARTCQRSWLRAEMRSRLQDLTLRYGLLETLDREHFYPTLESALEEIQARERSH